MASDEIVTILRRGFMEAYKEAADAASRAGRYKTAAVLYSRYFDTADLLLRDGGPFGGDEE